MITFPIQHGMDCRGERASYPLCDEGVEAVEGRTVETDEGEEAEQLARVYAFLLEKGRIGGESKRNRCPSSMVTG
jgi:hypothetical protein